MGNARDEPLKYEATYMSGDVMSVHPTTIRDTWRSNPQKYPAFHFQKMLREMFRENFWQKNFVWITWLCETPPPLLASCFALWCFHQVIDIYVKVVIKLDEVDWGLGLHLMDNHASSFRAVLFGVFHLLSHEAVYHLSGLTLRRGRVIWNTREPSLIKIEMTLWMIKTTHLTAHPITHGKLIKFNSRM